MALTLYRITATNKLVVVDSASPPAGSTVVTLPASNTLVNTTNFYRTIDTGTYAGWTPNTLQVTSPEVYDTTPPILILSGDAQVFTFNGLDALTPATQSITFSLNKQNILDATTWDTVSDVGGVTNLLTTKTDTSAVLTSASFGDNAFVQVTATCGVESDTFTVMRLTDGATVLIGYLTNEAHTVPATSTGGTSASGTFTGAGGTFKVYYGLDEVTNACTFVGTAGNCTGSVVTTGTTGRGVYSVTAITSTTTDVATYSIVATHPTYGAITKVFTISKSKAGSSNIKATLNNDTHVFPATSGGNIPAGSYTGSGTNINVYDGVKELSYDGSGTTAGKYTISSTPTNITRGTLTSTVVAGSNPSINYVVVGAHSGVADATDASAIVYTITGVDYNGTTFSITAQQSFSKSKAGVSPYSVIIESSNGDEFRVGQGKTTLLIARVFQDNAEITDVLQASQFKWRRVSVIDADPPNNDAAWNILYITGFKTITVDVDTVSSKATFFCDIYT